MRVTILTFTAALALFGAGAFSTSDSALAKGCLAGAAVGGVAGHYAGHHGLLGAAAGCVVGRHRANKQAHDMQQNGQPQNH